MAPEIGCLRSERSDSIQQIPADFDIFRFDQVERHTIDAFRGGKSAKGLDYRDRWPTVPDL
jgi:hypothetical protein